MPVHLVCLIKLEKHQDRSSKVVNMLTNFPSLQKIESFSTITNAQLTVSSQTRNVVELVPKNNYDPQR